MQFRPRILNFLKDFPPFSLMNRETLLQLSKRAVIRYLQNGEIVFEQGQSPEPFIYIVREGAVELFRETPNGSVRVDECDEGDLFWLPSSVFRYSLPPVCKGVGRNPAVLDPDRSVKAPGFRGPHTCAVLCPKPFCRTGRAIRQN